MQHRTRRAGPRHIWFQPGLSETWHAVSASVRRRARSPRGAVGPIGDLDFGARREALEERGVIGEREAALGELDVERVGESQIAEAEVMPVALAVGRDLHEGAAVGTRVLHGIGQGLAGRERAAEGDRVGELAVIEEKGDRAAGAVPVAVAAGAAGGSGALVHVEPGALAVHAHALRLTRREDRVAHPLFDERVESFVVGGRLGKPHPLGVAAEAEAEVRQTPPHLRDGRAPSRSGRMAWL